MDDDQVRVLELAARPAALAPAAEIVLQTYGGAKGVAKLEAAGDAAEAEFRRIRQQSCVPAAGLTDPSAIMFQIPSYTEADQGLVPARCNAVDPAFWRGWLGFDAMPSAARLARSGFGGKRSSRGLRG